MSVPETTQLADVLSRTYGLVTGVVDGLEPAEFGLRTRAEMWTIKDLLYHQLLDAQRALAAFASVTGAPADIDAVTYWGPFRPTQGDEGAEHARFVKQAAAAYGSPTLLVSWWRVFAESAPRSARTADPHARVQTQGHVLSVPDFISTLVVEATIHYLDLTLELPTAPPPPAAGLAEVRRVLSGILGAPLPDHWSDTDAALKGTGRLPLDDDDRAALGDRVGEVPLLS